MGSPGRLKNVKKLCFVERANDILRYGVACLQGKNIVSKVEGRVAIALILKRDLEEMGAWWQAERLNNWIHRAQGGEFS